MSELYVPAAQMPAGFMTLVVRTAGDPASLARAATAAIQDLDRNQFVSRTADPDAHCVARAPQILRAAGLPVRQSGGRARRRRSRRRDGRHGSRSARQVQRQVVGRAKAPGSIR